MPIPHPSFLYGESDKPPRSPLPLEARTLHFCFVVSPQSEPGADVDSIICPWEPFNCNGGAGTLVPDDYTWRHDMIEGGFRARTHLEAEIQWKVQRAVREGGRGKLEGWWPRIEKFPGWGKCFNVVFLRPNSFGCTKSGGVKAPVPATAPEAPAPAPDRTVERPEPAAIATAGGPALQGQEAATAIASSREVSLTTDEMIEVALQEQIERDTRRVDVMNEAEIEWKDIGGVKDLLAVRFL